MVFVENLVYRSAIIGSQAKQDHHIRVATTLCVRFLIGLTCLIGTD